MTSKIPHNNSLWIDRVSDQKKFPQLTGELSADVAVIGGGIVGVMAAWRLVQAGKRVVLLEKNHIATGDTGATTGFLTRVPDISLHACAEQRGIEFIQKLFTATAKAQEELCTLIQSQDISCELSRCDSYYGAYAADDETLKKEWETIRRANAGATLTSGRAKPQLPFVEAIRYESEGKCNIRKFLFGLLHERSPGDRLRVFEESEVVEVSVADGVIVKTREGSVKAEKLIVAVGDPSLLFPELNQILASLVTYVMAVRYPHPPFPDNLFWDTLDPYFYYRLVDATTILVGGCDIDAKSTATQEPYRKLEEFLRQRIPGAFEITHRWSGSIFHTSDGLPYTDAHPHYKGKVLIVTGLGGNGLVTGSLCARVVAERALGGTQTDEQALFSFVRTGVRIQFPERQAKREVRAKKFVAVGNVKEFKKPVGRTIEGRQIAVFPIEGKHYALENTCSHAGGSLCDGMQEGSVIECPLHGAKFDVRTGEVKGPPAVRSQQTFATRVSGDTLEVEIESPEAVPAQAPGAASPVGPIRKKYWKQLFIFSASALVFWLLELVYQYRVLIPGEFGGSLVRSFALAGATLFGFALFSSAIFRFFPRTAKLWRFRRYLGVSGFIFTFFHVLSVSKYLFDFDTKAVYYTLNPIENPIIFGSLAFPIFFILAATSTDWAVNKIGSKPWKFIHRFVYVAYLSAIFHFITINPQLLKNIAGYLLIMITVLAVAGQLYWFVKTVAKRGFRQVGTWVGIGIIVLAAAVGYIVYREKFAPRVVLPADEGTARDVPLPESVEKMKEFMAKNPAGDPEVAQEPITLDQGFEGRTVKQGTFQNLNYMTSGGASIEKNGEDSFVMFHEDFDTPDGPDLQVYLTKNSEPTRRKEVQEGILLGKLKSIRGKQVYKIPGGLNIDEYRSVTIHCRAFNVPWSYAPLQ